VKTTTYTVGDVMELVRRPVKVEFDKIYGEIGIRSFGRGIFHKDPVSGSVIGDKRVFSIEPGDLVFSNVFAWEGAVARATTRERGMIGSHRFMTYRVIDSLADADYLRYFFIGEAGLAVVRRASPGSAGRNRTLGIKAFEEERIPLPELDEQHRIAAKLDAVFHEQGRLTITMGQTDASSVARIVPRLIESVLERWRDGYGRVGDMCTIISDLVRPGDDPGPATIFVGLEHIAPHLGMRTGLRDVDNETGRKFRFAPGDVLYGYLRPYLNKVWIADRYGLCSVDQYVLRPNAGVSSEVLAFTLRSQTVLDQVKALTNNLQLPRLRSGLLLGLNVPHLSLARQEMAIEQLRQVHEKTLCYVAALRRRGELAGALQASLLNAAFTGRL
jgi:type I restriction enzyme, S subunit